MAGETLRTIADRYRPSKTALIRHKKNDLPRRLLKATQCAEVVEADALMSKITQLELEARRLGKKAEDAGDLRGAMAQCVSWCAS